MNLDHIDGRKGSGLAVHRVGYKVAAMLARLPDGYRRLLSLSDGIELGSGALIYSAQELVERNETYQVSVNLPGRVAIGDDGGGWMFLLRDGVTSPVLCIDMGAIGSLNPDVMAKSIESWVGQGFPLRRPTEMRTAKQPSTVDVFLIAVPEGKLANLIAMKSELGLDLAMAKPKTLAGNMPARARFGTCLGLRTK